MRDPLIAGVPVARLVAVLAEAGQTVATAESLTAGLLSATIAGVPGASAVLRGGLAVYATDLKASLAQVDPALLAADGPVSAAVAEQLAGGARIRCGADWGIGVTGVAGPESQGGVPVGTVFVAIVGPGGSTVQRLALPGGRWDVRWATVRAAVDGLLRRAAHVRQ